MVAVNVIVTGKSFPSGVVQFIPSATVRTVDGVATLLPDTILAVANGATFTATLPPTDIDAANPSGWTYRVVEPGKSGRVFSATLPLASAVLAGSVYSLDYSTLIPASTDEPIVQAMGKADAALAQVSSGRLSSASLNAAFGSPIVCPVPSGGDDRAAIQAKIDAATAGDTVTLRPGLYLVDLAPHPITAGYSAALTLPAGVRLVGAGKGATTIRLIANQTVGIDTQGVAVICNRALTGGDENVEVQDLTVDGNGANQTKLHNGIMFIRTRGAKCTRVRVMNVKGTSSFPPNETFHFDTQLGMDTTYADCEAIGAAGTQGSGFSANQATGIHYVDCVGRGMSAGMGFTHWQCETVTHSGCRAYLNGSNGFNSEESRDVSYSGCHGGGQTAPGSTPYPYAAATSLGNSGSGFVINGTKNAMLTGCTSRKNLGGISLVEGAGGASGRINACTFTENMVGVDAATTATLARWFIDPSTVCSGNTTAQYGLPAALGGYVAGPGVVVAPTPAIPASGVAVTNQYPWRVSVYLMGGTLALLRVNNADISTTTNHIVLDPGMTIGIWYSVAPTWLWFAL